MQGGSEQAQTWALRATLAVTALLPALAAREVRLLWSSFQATPAHGVALELPANLPEFVAPGPLITAGAASLSGWQWLGVLGVFATVALARRATSRARSWLPHDDRPIAGVRDL